MYRLHGEIEAAERGITRWNGIYAVTFSSLLGSVGDFASAATTSADGVSSERN